MTTETAVRIAYNDSFRDRVRYFMTKAAIAKLNAETPPNSDLILGQKVLDGGEPILAWSLGVLTNSSIMAGAHSDSGSTIPDNDIEFQINSIWSAFAK
jgi:hypothetical protein